MWKRPCMSSYVVSKIINRRFADCSRRASLSLRIRSSSQIISGFSAIISCNQLSVKIGWSFKFIFSGCMRLILFIVNFPSFNCCQRSWLYVVRDSETVTFQFTINVIFSTLPALRIAFAGVSFFVIINFAISFSL